MRILSLIAAGLWLLFLSGCATQEDNSKQPLAPESYPVVEHEVIMKLAGRTSTEDLTRLLGWDEEYYYFDWSQQKFSISRGTARAKRLPFDLANRGGLTLSTGLLTVENGQVRNLELQ